MRGYKPLRSLLRSALALRAADRRAIAHRCGALSPAGADPQQIVVTGNMKFDMPIPDGAVDAGRAMREHWGPRRPVWMAASTHEGEELAVLEAHLQVLKRLPDALLLLAPRHPERFRLVENAVRSLGFSVATHSADGVPSPSHQVFVIDAMGQLMPFFAAPTWPLSAAAWCRSAATTCWSRRPCRSRCWSARTPSTSRRSPAA